LPHFPARAMLVMNLPFKGVQLMTSHRILQLNAVSTAASALVMFTTRGFLHTLFGLETPILLDVIAAGFLVYAAALAWAANRQPVGRHALMAFTVADGLWVAASAIVLMMFWAELAPLARLLIIAVGLVVEVFATLQFRAARSTHPQVA
jgi:hypothetical protein